MEKSSPLTSPCSVANVKPIMMDLPYPEIQVQRKNPSCVDLLTIDYGGSVSEMTAITQYISHENRMFCSNCVIAKTLLGIAMAEMIHLQKLGELITLLGGSVDFVARYRGGKHKLWTPEYITCPEDARKILLVNLEAEKGAINQYRMHMRMINDGCVNAVLARIVRDEEYHIMILQALMNDL